MPRSRSRVVRNVNLGKSRPNQPEPPEPALQPPDMSDLGHTKGTEHMTEEYTLQQLPESVSLTAGSHGGEIAHHHRCSTQQENDQQESEKFDWQEGIILSGSPGISGSDNAEKSCEEEELSYLKERSDSSSNDILVVDQSEELPWDDPIRRPKPHRCCYCGVCDRPCLLKCSVCGNIFCNAKTGLKAVSHIVYHMIKSHHTSLSLFQGPPNVEPSPLCIVCQNRNVLHLAVVRNNSNVLVTVCQGGCLRKLPRDVWQVQAAVPFIHNHALPDWFVRQPPEEEVNALLKRSYGYAYCLNGLTRDSIDWWEKFHVEAQEIEAKLNEEKKEKESPPKDEVIQKHLTPIPTSFESLEEYQNIMVPIILEEAMDDAKGVLDEAQSLPVIQWKESKTEVIGIFPNVFPDQGKPLSIGEKLFLSDNPFPTGQSLSSSKFCKLSDLQKALHPKYANGDWHALVTIREIKPDSTLVVAMEGKHPKAPKPIPLEYHIRRDWNGTPFQRMIEAVQLFATDPTSMNPIISHFLLGKAESEDKSLLSELQDYLTTFIPFRSNQKLQMALRSIKHIDIPGRLPLDDSQARAVHHAMRVPLTVIQGPPGTGKTQVSISIIYNIISAVRETLSTDSNGSALSGPHVLACAPSNIAADQLACILETVGIKVARFFASSVDISESLACHLSFDQLCLEERQPPSVESDSKNISQLRSLYSQLAELERNGMIIAKDLARKVEVLKKLIAVDIPKYEVIVCTCSSAGAQELDKLRSKVVLIDESTQGIEPETLIPLVHGCEHLILVGDHKQLGPCISEETKKYRFGRSLFERLVDCGIRPVRIQIQYRMDPALSQFPSDMFYEGSLMNGFVPPSPQLELGLSKFPFPNKKKPLMFIHVDGRDEQSRNGTSWINRSEANKTIQVLRILLDQGLECKQIGIITPYSGQREYLLAQVRLLLDPSLTTFDLSPENKSPMETTEETKELGHLPLSSEHQLVLEDLEINSVDGFQGREKDVIIFSAVRSNPNHTIGFLRDTRRLNVAITRARYALIIIGNADTLGQSIAGNSIWPLYLKFFAENKALVEGPLSRLKQYTGGRFRVSNRFTRGSTTGVGSSINPTPAVSFSGWGMGGLDDMDEAVSQSDN